LKAKKKNYRLGLIGLVCVAVLVPVSWFLIQRLEGEAPGLVLAPEITAIGSAQKLTVTLADPANGLRKFRAGIVQNGREVHLIEKQFPSGGVLNGGQIHETSLDLMIDPRKLGLSSGEAVLRMVVSDFSWRGWWRGNRTYIERQVVIDTRPPEIDVLTRTHNITQGGSGLVIYRVSEPCFKTGVTVGNHFFPGRPGYFKDHQIFIAFFALSYRQGADTRLSVSAVDMAGNTTRAGFPYYIREKNFKNDTIPISDKFLNWKMPEFSTDKSKSSESMPMLDKFLSVNRNIRQKNYDMITGVARNSGTPEADIFWNGSFLRLPRSARRANFADQRVYRYNGRIIDRQTHLGVDLASVSHAPIPAANAGKVVFVDSIGIYGKTVIIDHGCGLYSTYSHLSGVQVGPGQMVARGDVIGHTGITGLAAGDHLHFGMMVHDVFVNPVEWWDSSWIRNNITSKIDSITSPADSTVP